MNTRHFDLHGLTLAIIANDDRFDGLANTYLAPFETGQNSEVDFRIHLTRTEQLSESDLGSHATLQASSETTDTTPALEQWIIDGDKPWLKIGDDVWLNSLEAEGWADIRIAPPHDPFSVGTAFLMALELALSTSNQFILHAAALSLPHDRGQCLLVFAPSGTGKTTTTLALGLGGFGVMTDDATILRQMDDGRFSAWGLPRPLKVHHKTVELLPKLSDAVSGPWDDNGEQAVTPNQIDQNILFEIGIPKQVDAIVWLTRHEKDGHILGAMDKASALSSVLSDHVRVSPDGVSQLDKKRIAALTAMLQSQPCYSLTTGPNIKSVADLSSPWRPESD